CFGDTLEYRGAKLYQEGSYSFVEEVRPMCFEETVLTLNVRPEIYVNDLAIMADDGNGNGALLVEVKGGTGALSYLWNTGATTESLFNVQAGSYSLTVTDAAACTARFDFEIPLVNATDDQALPRAAFRVRPTLMPRDGMVTLENMSGVLQDIRDVRWWSASGQVQRKSVGLSVAPGQTLALTAPENLAAGVLVVQVILADGRHWATRIVKP